MRYGILLAILMWIQLSASAGTVVSETAKLDALRDRIVRSVAALRGIRFKQQVKCELKEKDEVGKYVMKLIREQLPPERMSAYEKVLKRFGFISPDTDFAAALERILREQIVGLYDYNSTKLLMVKGCSNDMLELVLAHELTHALQDQYFKLKNLGVEDKTNDDRALAVEALIEGDAMRITQDYMMSMITNDPERLKKLVRLFGQLMGESKGFSEYPAYVRRNLIFPYVQGSTFVAKLFERGGNDLIDAAFCRPPLSTEQVIHPERFLEQRDDPVLINLPDMKPVLGEKWSELMTNVVGEFNIRVLFDVYDMGTIGKFASEGWDGDQFRAYLNEPEGTVFIAWMTTWDSTQDAREFYDAYRSLFDRKYRRSLRGVETREKPPSFFASTTAGAVYIERRDTEVGILDGFPQERLIPLREVMWQAEKTPCVADVLAKMPAEKDKVKSDKKQSEIDIGGAILDAIVGTGKQFEQLAKAMAGILKPSARRKVSGDTLYDEENQFTLRKPAQWEFDEDTKKGKMPAVLLCSERAASANAAVFPFPMSPIASWIELLEATLKEQFEDFRKISAGEFSWRGNEAYELTYSGKRDGLAVKIKQVIIVANGKTYVLTFGATHDGFDDAARDFRWIIDNFRVGEVSLPEERRGGE